MTRDWKNFYLDYHIHHVTGTIHNWQPILLYHPILELFYQEYNRLSLLRKIWTQAYVIMPEHFHLLIACESGEGVLKFLHGFRRSMSSNARRLIETADISFQEYCRDNQIDCKTFYTKTASKSEFRFWKEKPRVFPMNQEDAIQKKIEYIYMNPVRRGLVANPEDWPHSSVRAHLFNEPTRIPISWGPQDVVPKRDFPS